MAAPSNLVLQLLITAKDEASAAFGKLFSYLDNNTRVVANQIRAAFTGLFGGGLDGAIEFEAQLDRVIAKGDDTYRTYDNLASQISAVGAQFGLSGAEAAQGMESLAAAGLSAADAINALPQVLALAAAEQISADAAAQKLIDSLSIMGLGFEEAGRMADVLAKGANITTSSASQLAEALSEAGGTAKAAGLDLETAVAALDLLHKNGIKGSEAGTALKAILTALLDPASKASQELSALGISSRDLGTVMAALQQRGAAANAAILAFGTEAGPGLRALLAEGQSGLNDYTVQLRNADGAAADAAEQMGGNLKTALAQLASIWQSLKAAFLEPILAPVTASLKDFAKALQDGLSSATFATVQATIRQFGEQAAQSIRGFVQSFDFAGALKSLGAFVVQTGQSFGAIASAGQQAASVVQIAWNGITAGFRTLGAGMVEIVASLVATLANIEEAASKIGLGTVEQANALRGQALGMQATAQALLSGVAQDGRDMAAAMERLTQQAEQADGALKTVKETAETPVNAVGLEPINKTLADYAGQLERAKIAQAQAAQAASDAEADYLLLGDAIDKGTGSAYRYEQAAMANQAAQVALRIANDNLTQASSDYTVAVQHAIRETDAEAASVTQIVQTKEQKIAQLKTEIAQAQRYNDALSDTAQAQLAAKDADIALAEAMGHTAQVQQLQNERAMLAAQLALEQAEGKRDQQQQELAMAQALREQVAARVANNQASQQDLALADLRVRKSQADLEATEKYIQVQEQLRRQAEIMAGPVGELIALYQRKTAALSRETEAIERGYDRKLRDLNVELDQAKAKGDSAKVAELLIKIKDAEAEKAQAVADAKIKELQAEIDLMDAKRLALLAEGDLNAANQEKLAALDAQIAKLKELQDAEQDHADSVQAEAEAARNAADTTDERTQATEENTQAARDNADAVEYQIRGIDRLNEKGKELWAAMRASLATMRGFSAESTVGAINEIIQSIESLIAAEEVAAEKVDELAATYERGGEAGRQALAQLQHMGDGGVYAIQGITDAGEAARQKIKQIQQAAMDAEQALADMATDYRKQILQLQGDEQALLDIEHQERLDQLAELHEKSGRLGDEEYRQAIRQANELHRLKLAQLAEEAQENTATTRLNDLADAAERAGSAVRDLAGINLSTINDQATRLAKSFSDLDGVL
jgi:TP901 family phage tail tape measure protein